MPQLLTVYGVKSIRLRAGIRNENTSCNNRWRTVITVLHRHRPKHCSIRFIDGINGSTASSSAFIHNSIRSGRGRRKSVLTWEIDTPERSAGGSVKSLHQSVKVNN